MKDNTWVIILAAGASTRMKKQKMLLPFNGKTIIETVVDHAAQLVDSNIIVVLGSHKEDIASRLSNHDVKIAVNDNYREGMLSSVISGFRSVPESAGAVVVFLGDQPQIPVEVSRLVFNAWKGSTKGIAIPTFNGRRGHPVIIDSGYRVEIEKLDPEKGLRELWRKNKEDILEVKCHYPEILRDIDRPSDYRFETNMI